MYLIPDNDDFVTLYLQLPLSALIGEACVIDVEDSSTGNADYLVDVQDLTGFENEFGLLDDCFVVCSCSLSESEYQETYVSFERVFEGSSHRVGEEILRQRVVSWLGWRCQAFSRLDHMQNTFALHTEYSIPRRMMMTTARVTTALQVLKRFRTVTGSC